MLIKLIIILKFNKVSQTIRRELEHFDFVMREEFEEAFKAYHESYWRAMRAPKKISDLDAD